MKDFSPIYKLPTVPAVYALYSGGRGPQYVAYVGIAGILKRRIIQHFIRRDSSVTTGTSAVSLNPDLLTSMVWWEHPSFSETVNLKAAEMVAFDVLQPALRSRGYDDGASKEVLKTGFFRDKMTDLFQGPPTGSIKFLTLTEAMQRIDQLEKRIEALEALVMK